MIEKPGISGCIIKLLHILVIPEHIYIFPVVESCPLKIPVICAEAELPTRWRTEPVAAQTRAIFPVLGGISGSRRTTCSGMSLVCMVLVGTGHPGLYLAIQPPLLHSAHSICRTVWLIPMCASLCSILSLILPAARVPAHGSTGGRSGQSFPAQWSRYVRHECRGPLEARLSLWISVLCQIPCGVSSRNILRASPMILTPPTLQIHRQIRWP